MSIQFNWKVLAIFLFLVSIVLISRGFLGILGSIQVSQLNGLIFLAMSIYIIISTNHMITIFENKNKEVSE